jgi:hypothetical protein
MTENPSAAPDPLALATQMVKSGRLEDAQAILVRYLASHPASEQAWLLMSYVVKDFAQQKDCLERVLRLNSGNLVARSKLAQLNKARTGSMPPVEENKSVPEPRSDQLSSDHESRPSPASPPDLEKTNVSKRQQVKQEIPAVHPPTPVSGQDISPKFGPPHGSNRAEMISRIAIIALIIIIAGIVLTVVYLGMVAPMLQKKTSTPTEIPTVEIVFTMPPAWTPTNTPTVTPTVTITSTATPTSTDTPEPTVTKTLRP